jgi:uncharacterized protein (UPF0261 family)
MLCFHANGCGGMAMEGLIAEGKIRGVLDFTPHELADDSFGGYCKGIGEGVSRQQVRWVSLWYLPLVVSIMLYSAHHTPCPLSLNGRSIYMSTMRGSA